MNNFRLPYLITRTLRWLIIAYICIVTEMSGSVTIFSGTFFLHATKDMRTSDTELYKLSNPSTRGQNNNLPCADLLAGKLH